MNLDELEKLNQLKKAGYLTEDEFNAHKSRILGLPPPIIQPITPISIPITPTTPIISTNPSTISTPKKSNILPAFGIALLLLSLAIPTIIYYQNSQNKTPPPTASLHDIVIEKPKPQPVIVFDEPVNIPDGHFLQLKLDPGKYEIKANISQGQDGFTTRWVGNSNCKNLPESKTYDTWCIAFADSVIEFHNPSFLGLGANISGFIKIIKHPED